MPLLVSALSLAAVYVAVGFVERRPRLRFRTLTSPRPFLATDVAWYGMAIGATAVSLYVFQPVLSRLAIGPLARAVDALPPAVTIVLGLVVFDFVSFTVHRMLHRSDVLWSFHKVHHSTLELDSFATTRTHMFENLVRFVPGQLVLFLLGIPVPVVATVVAVAALYGISNHSNLETRIRWIEAILVTPRLHRRHHVPSTTLTNYGTIFTIWDRLNGSLLRRDTSADERYGVPGEIDTYPQRFGDAVRQPFVQNRARAQRRGTVSRDRGASLDA